MDIIKLGENELCKIIVDDDRSELILKHKYLPSKTLEMIISEIDFQLDHIKQILMEREERKPKFLYEDEEGNRYYEPRNLN